MPTDPLDILWDQVQIAYAAIIRAPVSYTHLDVYKRQDKGQGCVSLAHRRDAEGVSEVPRGQPMV